MTDLAAPDLRIGPLLRSWRERRRLSQLDLALEAGVSARHVSFVETGRSRPSAEMVLHLADQLDVPLRDRNAMLLAAGYAPAFKERPLDAPEMTPVRDALQLLLDGHDPYPAVAVDRRWNLVAANHGLGILLEGVAPELLRAPANAMRIALHPDGMAPHVVNLAVYRADLLERVRRVAAATGDPFFYELLEELGGYPAPDEDAPPPSGHEIFVPLRMRAKDGSELSFFSTIATFGTAVDITVAELAIESFFPADEHTAEAVRDYLRGN
jgi:transcriptional regulator with XRE-family HTH domain